MDTLAGTSSDANCLVSVSARKVYPHRRFQVLQRRVHDEREGVVCSATVSKITTYCGAFDHGQLHLGDVSLENEQEISESLCREVWKTGRYQDRSGRKRKIVPGRANVFAFFRSGRTYVSAGEIKCAGGSFMSISPEGEDIFYTHSIQWFQYKFRIHREKIAVPEEGGYLTAIEENRRLIAAASDGTVYADGKRYFWNPEPDPCQLDYVRTIIASKVIDDYGGVTILAEDSSRLRLMVGEEQQQCGFSVHSSPTADGIFLLELTDSEPGFPETGGMPRQLRLGAHLALMGETLKGNLLSDFTRELRKLWQAYCLVHQRQESLINWHQHTTPDFLTYFYGRHAAYSTQGKPYNQLSNLISVPVGEGTEIHRCIAVPVLGIEVEDECHDSIPVVNVRPEDEAWFRRLHDAALTPGDRRKQREHRGRPVLYLHALTRRLLTTSKRVECSQYRRIYKNIFGRYVTFNPKIVLGAKPKSAGDALDPRLFQPRFNEKWNLKTSLYTSRYVDRQLNLDAAEREAATNTEFDLAMHKDMRGQRKKRDGSSDASSTHYSSVLRAGDVFDEAQILSAAFYGSDLTKKIMTILGHMGTFFSVMVGTFMIVQFGMALFACSARCCLLADTYKNSASCLKLAALMSWSSLPDVFALHWHRKEKLRRRRERQAEEERAQMLEELEEGRGSPLPKYESETRFTPPYCARANFPTNLFPTNLSTESEKKLTEVPFSAVLPLYPRAREETEVAHGHREADGGGGSLPATRAERPAGAHLPGPGGAPAVREGQPVDLSGAEGAADLAGHRADSREAARNFPARMEQGSPTATTLRTGSEPLGSTDQPESPARSPRTAAVEDRPSGQLQLRTLRGSSVQPAVDATAPTEVHLERTRTARIRQPGLDLLRTGRGLLPRSPRMPTATAPCRLPMNVDIPSVITSLMDKNIIPSPKYQASIVPSTTSSAPPQPQPQQQRPSLKTFRAPQPPGPAPPPPVDIPVSDVIEFPRDPMMISDEEWTHAHNRVACTRGEMINENESSH